MLSSMTECSKLLNKIKTSITTAVIVREELIDNMLICLCNEGHILLEDMPGTGKTTIAKALANSIDASFKRIQCVPDILPSDITGISYFNQKDNDFVFKKGPVFANIILADEINRASPRSQAALLECMEEKQVTVDNATYQLDRPFIVMATQNPIETRGTFPLPEAQLDRFMMKLSLGYPSKEMENTIIDINLNSEPVKQITPVTTAQEIVNIRSSLEKITISQPIKDYIIEIVQATRASNSVMMGASPRAAIALARAAQARALLYNRSYAIPDDIKALVVPVLSHRLITDSAQTPEKILESFIEKIPAPVTE